jgi:hypothetical protein
MIGSDWHRENYRRRPDDPVVAKLRRHFRLLLLVVLSGSEGTLQAVGALRVATGGGLLLLPVLSQNLDPDILVMQPTQN